MFFYSFGCVLFYQTQNNVFDQSVYEQSVMTVKTLLNQVAIRDSVSHQRLSNIKEIIEPLMPAGLKYN